MARERGDLWDAMERAGEPVATEEAYEHGYTRVVRKDLRQYVAFRVANELYGLDIDNIVEISKVFMPTPVPHAAPFVMGIGTVRGNVIPVVDLATRLRLHRDSISRSTRVLIVRHHDELYGLVVDAVVGAVSLAPESMEDAPGTFTSTRADFIEALGRHEGEILIVLSLDALLDPRDFVRKAGGRS